MRTISNYRCIKNPCEYHAKWPVQKIVRLARDSTWQATREKYSFRAGETLVFEVTRERLWTVEKTTHLAFKATADMDD